MILYRYTAAGLLDRELVIVWTRGEERTTIHEEKVPAGTAVTVPLTINGPGTLEVFEDGYLIEEREINE